MLYKCYCHCLLKRWSCRWLLYVCVDVRRSSSVKCHSSHVVCWWCHCVKPVDTAESRACDSQRSSVTVGVVTTSVWTARLMICPAARYSPTGNISTTCKCVVIHLLTSVSVPLAKWTYIPDLTKIGRQIRALSWTQAYKWAKPEVNWHACAFTTLGVTVYRTYSSLSDVWPTFQIWGRSYKNCRRYRDR